MKTKQRKLNSDNSRSSNPGAFKTTGEDEVLKRFYEQLLKNFGHIR